MLPRLFYPLSTTTSRLFIRMTKISFPHSQENYIIEMTLTTCFRRNHLIWTFLAMYRFREVEEYLRGVIIEPNTVDESVLDCRMASVLFQWQILYLFELIVTFRALHCVFQVSLKTIVFFRGISYTAIAYLGCFNTAEGHLLFIFKTLKVMSVSASFRTVSQYIHRFVSVRAHVADGNRMIKVWPSL